MNLKFEFMERDGVTVAMCSPAQGVALVGIGATRADAERKCAAEVFKWLSWALGDERVGTRHCADARPAIREGVSIEFVDLVESNPKPLLEVAH